VYKRQIYQIAESNRIEKNRFGSENRIDSNRNFFLPELACSTAMWTRGGPRNHLLSKEPLIEWELKFSKLESVLWRGYLSMHTAQTCWRGRRIQYTQRYSTEGTSDAASGYQYCSNCIIFMIFLFYFIYSEASILWSRHRETRKLHGEEDNARNMPGARRRGRPRTAWMDNIKTWTGLPVEESIG